MATYERAVDSITAYRRLTARVPSTDDSAKTGGESGPPGVGTIDTDLQMALLVAHLQWCAREIASASTNDVIPVRAQRAHHERARESEAQSSFNVFCGQLTEFELGGSNATAARSLFDRLALATATANRAHRRDQSDRGAASSKCGADNHGGCEDDDDNDTQRSNPSRRYNSSDCADGQSCRRGVAPVSPADAAAAAWGDESTSASLSRPSSGYGRSASPSPVPPLVVGNRYRLTKALGSGANGVCVVAEDVRTRERLALKKLPDVLRDRFVAIQVIVGGSRWLVRAFHHFDFQSLSSYPVHVGARSPFGPIAHRVRIDPHV